MPRGDGRHAGGAGHQVDVGHDVRAVLITPLQDFALGLDLVRKELAHQLAHVRRQERTARLDDELLEGPL